MFTVHTIRTILFSSISMHNSNTNIEMVLMHSLSSYSSIYQSIRKIIFLSCISFGSYPFICLGGLSAEQSIETNRSNSSAWQKIFSLIGFFLLFFFVSMRNGQINGNPCSFDSDQFCVIDHLILTHRDRI